MHQSPYLSKQLFSKKSIIFEKNVKYLFNLCDISNDCFYCPILREKEKTILEMTLNSLEMSLYRYPRLFIPLDNRQSLKAGRMTYSYLIKAASGIPFSYCYKTKLPLSDKSYQQQNRQKRQCYN